MTAAKSAPSSVASVGDDGAFNIALSKELQDIWIDRDLSWLDFNERVLAEALDERNPLLERAKFLAIVTANADEFFMKRISVLRENPAAGTTALLRQLREKLLSTIEKQAECWKQQIVPGLAKHGIFLRRWEELTSAQQAQASKYFDDQVAPALTPLAMTAGDHFPFLSNLSTSLVFPIEDETTREKLFARVKVPNGPDNWLSIEADVEPDAQVAVRLHDVIRANLSKLYPGMIIGPTALVRLTRDAEVEAADDDTVHAVDEIRRQIRQRRFEPVVRLEFTRGVDPGIRELLAAYFRLSPSEVYEAPDDLDCSTLFGLGNLRAPQLKDVPWNPVKPPTLAEHPDLFAAIRAADLLVHHPYESFDATVGHFVDQAASDPAVVSIKMTVYRVGDDTPFVRSLIRAAEAGKQVACVIELKARFDEERNLHWASALEKAGAHVIYGVRGLKIHGKSALVVRREAGGLRAYAHIGTGNYHSRTAKLYSDIGLFTADASVTRDVVSLFHYLTAHSRPPAFDKLLVAPHAMREWFLQWIDREIENKRSGRPAHIVAKMNQLEDPEMIDALRRASVAGVPVDLIVRGFCCLKPGVPGHTDNIRVFSIIGRFLEHSRIFYFANGSADLQGGEIYIGSADWMFRNLSKRVEVVTPVFATEPRRRLAEVLAICLNDRRQSWSLDSNGIYTRRQAESGDGEQTATQTILMNLAAAN